MTEIDEYVIMPNHVHGILKINVGTGQCPVRTVRTGINDRYGLLSKAIKSYKNAVTNEIRRGLQIMWERDRNNLANAK